MGQSEHSKMQRPSADAGQPQECSRIAFLINRAGTDDPDILVALGLLTTLPDGTPEWRPTGNDVLKKNRAYYRVWAAMILARLMRTAEYGLAGKQKAESNHWQFQREDFAAATGNEGIEDVYTHLLKGIESARHNELDLTEACYQLTFLTPRAEPTSGCGKEDRVFISKMFTKGRDSFGLKTASPISGNDILIYDFEEWMARNAERNKPILNAFFKTGTVPHLFPAACLIDDQTPEGERKLAALVVRLARRWGGKQATSEDDVTALLDIIHAKRAGLALNRRDESIQVPTFPANESGLLVLGLDHDDAARSASRTLATAIDGIVVQMSLQAATFVHHTVPLTVKEAGKGQAPDDAVIVELIRASKAKCIIWGEYFESSHSVQLRVTINHTRLQTLMGRQTIRIDPIPITDLAKKTDVARAVISGLLFLFHGCALLPGKKKASEDAARAFVEAKNRLSSIPDLAAVCIQYEWMTYNCQGDVDRAHSLLDAMLVTACSEPYNAGFSRHTLDTLYLALAAGAIAGKRALERVERGLIQLYRLADSPLRSRPELLTGFCRTISGGLLGACSQGREADTRKLGILLLDLGTTSPSNVDILTCLAGSIPLALPTFESRQAIEVSHRLIGHYRAIEPFLNRPDVLGHVRLGLSRMLHFLETLPEWNERIAELLAWARSCCQRVDICPAGQRILADCLVAATAIAKEHGDKALAAHLQRELDELAKTHPHDTEILLCRALALCNEMKSALAESDFTRLDGYFGELRTTVKAEGLSRYAAIALCYGIQMSRNATAIRKDLDAKEKRVRAAAYQNEIDSLTESTGWREVWLISQLGELAEAGLGYYHNDSASRDRLDTLAEELIEAVSIRNDVLSWHLVDCARLLASVAYVAKEKATTGKSKKDEALLERYLRLLFALAKANPENTRIQVEYAKATAESSSTSEHCLATVWELTLAYYPLAAHHYSPKVNQAFAQSLAATMAAITEPSQFGLARMAVDWLRTIHATHPADGIITEFYAATLTNAVPAFARLNRIDEVCSCVDELGSMRGLVAHSARTQIVVLMGLANACRSLAKHGREKEFAALIMLASEMGLPQTMTGDDKAVVAQCLHRIIGYALVLGLHEKVGELFESMRRLAAESGHEERVALVFGWAVDDLMKKAAEDRRLEDFTTLFDMLSDLVRAHPENSRICQLLARTEIRLATIDSADPRGEMSADVYGEDGHVWEGARCPVCMKGVFAFYDRHTGRYGLQTAWYFCQHCKCWAQSDEPLDCY